MNHEIGKSSAIIPKTAGMPKSYDQQEGEPDMWYDRFIKFCLYGNTRNIRQCYRDVMAERDILLGLAAPESTKGSQTNTKTKAPSKPRRKYLPSSWIKRVKEFDWWARAAAWDATRREKAIQRSEEAINLVCEVSPEMVNLLINIARGEVRDKNGEIKEVNDIRERRQAATTLLKMAGVVYDGPQPGEEDGEIKVVGITIHRSGETDGD